MAAARAARAPGTMPDVGRLSSPVLVGRDEELARLTSVWEAACQGRPSLALVGGDAGVGKTRLLESVTATVEQGGGRVLRGGCIDVGDGGLPFAALIDALRGLTQHEDAARLPELLGPARRQLARLVPALGSDATEGEPPSPVIVLQSTLDALGRLGGSSPVLFLVEDIHWADRSTLDLLAYLARNVRDEALLIVATYRTDELHRRHQLRPFLAELSRARTIERIDLSPFDREQMADQLAAILDGVPPAHLVDEILSRSDGNPFLAEELLAARGAGDRLGLPVGLRDILDARIGDLPPEARRILDVAATIGRTAHHALLAAVGADVAGDLRVALRTVVDHQLLVPEPDGRYRFRHALVQEAVHDALLPGERIELHRAVAEALAREPALASGGAEHVEAELAHHWEQAGDRERAYRSALRAADHARGLPAFPEALAQYERALGLRAQLPEEERALDALPDILLGAVKSAMGAGNFRRGVAHQKALLELVPDRDASERADALRRLARLQWFAGEGDSAAATIRQAADLVTDRAPTRTKAGVLAYLARITSLQGRPADALPAAEEAVAIADAIGDDVMRSEALNSLGLATYLLDRHDESIVHLWASLAAAKAVGTPDLVAAAYNNLVSIAATTLDPGSLDDLCDEIGAWLENYDQHAGAAFVLANLAEIATLRGDLAAATPLLDRAARHRLDGALLMNHLAISSWVATIQGDYETADRLADDLRAVAARTPDPQTWSLLLESSAIRELLRDRPAAALDRLDELEERLRGLVRPLAAMPSMTTRVWALVELALTGDDDAASRVPTAIAELEHFEAGRAEGTHYAGLVEFARGLASRLSSPAPEHWRAAADKATQAWWRALALLGEAEALLAGARREEATDALRRAYELSERLDSKGLRERAVALARRGRLEIGAPELHGADDLGLTPRENEVLALVAEGCTNREIGEHLFIAEKTASVHVSNILAKLDVDNRGAAAAAAHRLGLVTVPTASPNAEATTARTPRGAHS